MLPKTQGMQPLKLLHIYRTLPSCKVLPQILETKHVPLRLSRRESHPHADTNSWVARVATGNRAGELREDLRMPKAWDGGGGQWVSGVFSEKRGFEKTPVKRGGAGYQRKSLQDKWI